MADEWEEKDISFKRVQAWLDCEVCIKIVITIKG
jgi:hypothetical protein